MRITLRDLFWLTLVVGVALAWWLHYRQYSIWDERGAMLDMQLRATGWTVHYSDDEDFPELILPETSDR